MPCTILMQKALIAEEKPASYSSQTLAVDAEEIPITYTECSKANEENKELIGLLTQLSESMHLNCIFKMVMDPVYIRSNGRTVTLHGIHLISEENVYIPNEAKQAIANHEILTRDGFCSVEWFRMDGASGAAAKDEKICTDDFIGKILISCNDWPLLREELELALALKFSALSVSETNDSMAGDKPQSSVGIRTDAKHPILNNQYESSSSSSSPVSTANAEIIDTERLSSLGL